MTQNDRLDRSLVAAVTDTLENMTFMEAVPSKEIGELVGQESLTAGLHIQEPWPADLRLTLSRPLLEKVAESVFALPADELEENVLRDLLAEILNTLAGRFLTGYLPADQNYQLGLPEFGTENALPIDTPERQWNFRMEEELFSLRLRGDVLQHP